MNMTADAVALQETRRLFKFPEGHNLQRTRHALSAGEITTLFGIIVI